MTPPRGIRKGNPFARLVATYLDSEPRALNGTRDRGDIVHRTWAIEVKCPGRGQPLNLSTAMNEARREADNAAVHQYAVVTRRTGYPLDEAFFTIPLWMARQIIPDLLPKQPGL